jgi:hypothetical protein
VNVLQLASAASSPPAIEALVEIGDLVEEFTKSRFGTDDLAKVPGGEEYHLLPDLNRRFAPYPE